MPINMLLYSFKYNSYNICSFTLFHCIYIPTLRKCDINKLTKSIIYFSKFKLSLICPISII